MIDLGISSMLFLRIKLRKKKINGRELKIKKKRRILMQHVKVYLSTAPVVATIWFGLLAGLLIEINRFFPDALLFPFF